MGGEKGNMFKTILVPTDGSPLSDRAIKEAIGVARQTGGKIVALSVAEPYPFSPMAEGAIVEDAGQYETRMRDLARAHVEKIVALASAQGIGCEAVTELSFNPYEQIIATAKSHECDVIFMASHGRKGLNKLFLGSETDKVLSHCTIPVLVFR